MHNTIQGFKLFRPGIVHSHRFSPSGFVWRCHFPFGKFTEHNYASLPQPICVQPGHVPSVRLLTVGKMVGGFPVRILVFAALGLYAVHSEVCHVQPQCTCTRRNNSYIVCDKMSTPYIPFLGMSNFQFYDLKIRGNPDVKFIHDGTFGGLKINWLDIQFTGISEFNCTDFSGIRDKVSRIYLPNNLLKRVPSCALARFRSTTTLDLSNNSITSLSFGDFDPFLRLQTLELSMNKISSIALATFRELNELTDLDLSHNDISILSPRVFDGLVELDTLNLDFNKLAWLEGDLFSETGKLRVLYVRNNRLSHLSGTTFKYLTQLSHLFLSDNNISRVIPATFQKLSRLNLLHLDNNSLSETGPGMFSGLSKTLIVRLGNNKLTEVKTNAFVDFPHIETINLTGNAIQNMQTGSFRNLAGLYRVDISGNQLRDIGPGVFSNVSLRDLFLHNNGLSNTSWSWLAKLLGHLKELRMLDLSYNHLSHIPASVLPILETITQVRMRNCSLHEVPDNAWNFSLDVSMNNIQGPLILRNSHMSRFDVSNNNITSLNIKTLMVYHDVSITCDNNKIEDYLVVEINFRRRYHDRFNFIKVSAKNNKIDKTIQLLFQGKQGRFSYINVDLSGNSYVNVTNLPLDVQHLSGEIVWTPCRPSISRVYVNLLNLSANAISYISPEACLGIVGTLDLRNNRLEVLNELMPKTDSLEYRLGYLYLSGNRLHRATTEAFDRNILLYHLDLRNNYIASLDSFNISGKFQKLSLTGNPLSCGCDIAWLRNATVPDQMDAVRCQSPQAFSGYLAVCFSLSACPASVSLSVSDSTEKLCSQDSNIKLSNLNVTVENDLLRVSWTKRGPGRMTGYRVEYHPVNHAQMGASTLVHPEEEKMLIIDLSKNTNYSLCVFAVLHSQSKSPVICTEIHVGAQVDLITARKRTTYAEAGVVIGLASALGLFVLLAGAVIVCLCVRQRRSGQNQASDLTLDTAPANPQPAGALSQIELDDEITSVYVRRSVNESQTEDRNVYAKIGTLAAYENTSFRA